MRPSEPVSPGGLVGPGLVGPGLVGPGEAVLAAAVTVPGLLAARRGDRTAVVDDSRSVTYAELDDASRSRAAGLVGAGLTKSSRVGLLAPNSVDWVVTALAVTRIGAVLVPLSTLLRPPELLGQLRVAAVTHLVAVDRIRGRSPVEELDSVAPGLVAAARAGHRHPAAPALRQIWSPEHLPDAAAPRQEVPRQAVPRGAVTGAAAPLVEALEAQVRAADDLVILFTSGSRGTPKGVIHTHGSALRAAESGLDARCLGPDDRLYLPMPFFWTGGFGAGVLAALVAGAALVTESEPEPGRTLRLLERHRVTLFRGWPDQAERLAAHPAFATTDLSRLRPASLPGVLPPDRRPVPGARANVFGMTETLGPYCGARLDVDLPAGKEGSSGRPFAGVEVRIADPASGVPVGTGTEGEIRVRGRSLMRGICGRQRADVFDADGFYPTGDLGVLDEDGYLWFRGRLDDMFKVSGATVYPIEVETALRGLPGVAEAYVTEHSGRVAALVVASRSASASPAGGAFAAPAEAAPGVTAEGLAAAARERLSGFKVPTRWLVVDDPSEVPRSASGKVDLTALRELLSDR